MYPKINPFICKDPDTEMIEVASKTSLLRRVMDRAKMTGPLKPTAPNSEILDQIVEKFGVKPEDDGVVALAIEGKVVEPLKVVGKTVSTYTGRNASAKLTQPQILSIPVSTSFEWVRKGRRPR